MSKIAFVHIPKSAGASIRSWANTNHLDNFVSIGHNSLKEYKDNDLDWTYDTSIAIPRNTYSRMISLYNFAKYKTLKNLEQAKRGKRVVNEVQLRESLTAWEKGITYFLDYILEYSFSHHNQMKYIKDVDILIRYENLQTDFYKIQELTNCNAPLVQHIHNYKDKKYVTSLSSDYIKCIKRHFKEELEYFNYKAEL